MTRELERCAAREFPEKQKRASAVLTQRVSLFFPSSHCHRGSLDFFRVSLTRLW